MATFLIVATNAIAAGTPGVNNVLSAQQRTETWWYYFGGQKVIFYMHEVKTRTNKVFAENGMETEASYDGYFYFKQKGKRVKYTVKADISTLGSMGKTQGDIYLNGKKVGHYATSDGGLAGDTGIMTLNGKEYKMRF